MGQMLFPRNLTPHHYTLLKWFSALQNSSLTVYSALLTICLKVWQFAHLLFLQRMYRVFIQKV